MKAHLMFRDGDLDLERPLPPNAESLEQDLELNTLFDTMARGDAYLRELAEKALLSGLTDPEAILYRQQIVADCLAQPVIVRELYDIAVEGVESKKQARFFWFRDSPEAVLQKSLGMLDCSSPFSGGYGSSPTSTPQRSSRTDSPVSLPRSNGNSTTTTSGRSTTTCAS